MTPVCRLPCVPRKWWRGKDSNLRRRKPADLQSAPVGRLGTPPGKNEPRILVTTPRGVNGIGATFAMSATGTERGFPGLPGTDSSYIGVRCRKSASRAPGWRRSPLLLALGVRGAAELEENALHEDVRLVEALAPALVELPRGRGRLD